MHKETPFVFPDRFCELESLVNVVSENEFGPVRPAGIDACRIGGADHHDFRAGACRFGRISSRNRVVTGADRCHAGGALFVRGYLFVTSQEVLYDFIDAQGLLVAGMAIHYISLAHLYGGFIMAFGLLTRVAALVQVPILASAVFLVHLDEGLFSSGQSFELAMLVLFLLLVICAFGPGKLSLDYSIEAALMRNEGPLGRLLVLIDRREAGDFEGVSELLTELGLDWPDLERAELEAVTWTDGLSDVDTQSGSVTSQ